MITHANILMFAMSSWQRLQMRFKTEASQAAADQTSFSRWTNLSKLILLQLFTLFN